jgi:hypothetical protein
MNNAQRIIKLTGLPREFINLTTRGEIVDTILPLITGSMKCDFEERYETFDEESYFYVSGSDFINSLLRQHNGDKLLNGYRQTVAPLEYDTLLIFDKSCAEEIFI